MMAIIRPVQIIPEVGGGAPMLDLRRLSDEEIDALDLGQSDDADLFRVQMDDDLGAAILWLGIGAIITLSVGFGVFLAKVTPWLAALIGWPL